MTEPDKKPDAENGREPVYYYSRSRRLERASPALRAFNEEQPQTRPSLVKSLTASKPQAILFFTIVVFMILGFIISFLYGGDDQLKLGGNTVEVSAMIFEGNTYLALKKTFKNDGEAYTGAVDLGVSPVFSGGGKKSAGDEGPAEPEDYPVWAQRIFFTLKNGEEYRFALPFEAPRLLVLLQAETGEQAAVQVTVK
jgi:hypothetical protein